MMTTFSLQDGFAKADEQQWLARVRETLKGDEPESLDHRTFEGLLVRALETGGKQRTRPGGRRHGQAAWIITQLLDIPDAAMANAQALEDLNGGASGLCLAFAGRPAVGDHGLDADGAEALARILRDVEVDMIATRIDAGPAAASVARWLREVAIERNYDLARIDVDYAIDPLTCGLASGRLPERAEAQSLIGEWAAMAASDGKTSGVFAADGRIAHDAGGGDAQELASMAAAVVEIIRMAEANGVEPGDAARLISLIVAADADQFATIAKVRAARLIWANIAKAHGVAALPARIHAQTSWRMMARNDAHVNMLRTTSAAFAAAVGGADSICVLPFSRAIGLPEAHARRMARNAQIIIMEEARIGRVEDAGAGSGQVEAMSLVLAEKAWALLQDIERRGGLLEALKSGWWQDEIATVAAARAKAVATREIGLTGVSEYATLDEAGVDLLACEAPGAGSAATMTMAVDCPALPPARLSEPFEALRKSADAFAAAAGGKRPAVFLASLGPLARFTARATWMSNLLAAGGVAAAGGKEYADIDELAADLAASGASCACIVGDDAAYAALGEAAVKTLRRAGAGHVLIAGDPARSGGLVEQVDGFAYAGCDVLALLGDVHGWLGIAAQR